MGQWVMVLTPKIDNLNFTTGPVWWKEKTDSCKLSSNLHIVCYGMLTHKINVKTCF